MVKTSQMNTNTSVVSTKVICYKKDSDCKWHPSTTPTLKRRFIDFSLLKKTLEKLYLKSKTDEPTLINNGINGLTNSYNVYASPPSLVHSTNSKWNPLTPSLQNIDFIQLKDTIEKLYSGEAYKIEKSLKF